MTRTIVAIGALLLVTSGCGNASDEPAKPAAPKSQTNATPTAWAGTPIRFRASDGVSLEGRFVPGRGRRAPAVILIHQYRGGPEQWQEFVPVLKRAGYAVLNYASRSAQELDETVLARDVLGAVKALRRRHDVDPRRIALVGASIGGSAAVWVAGVYRNTPVRAAVGLSAVEGPALIDMSTKGRFRPHDLLLIADRKEFSQAQNIRDDADGRGVTTWMSPFGGHGVALLPSAAVRQRVLDWLRTRLGAG
jgi:alpha-beta hydrolase superfamily lysophospholipase